jgi:hypothetical protein
MSEPTLRTIATMLTVFEFIRSPRAASVITGVVDRLEQERQDQMGRELLLLFREPEEIPNEP